MWNMRVEFSIFGVEMDIFIILGVKVMNNLNWFLLDIPIHFSLEYKPIH